MNMRKMFDAMKYKIYFDLVVKKLECTQHLITCSIKNITHKENNKCSKILYLTHEDNSNAIEANDPDYL